MFGLQVIVQMEWQYQPEHRTGTPDEDCLSEAGGELWMISVPRQVTVPEGNIPAQACKRGGIILLHIISTLLKNFSVHFISKIFFIFLCFNNLLLALYCHTCYLVVSRVAQEKVESLLGGVIH